MKLACVLIAAIFREHLVCLVLLGHVARMASLVNDLSVPHGIIENANTFRMRIRTGMSMSAACNILGPWNSPDVAISVHNAASFAEVSLCPKSIYAWALRLGAVWSLCSCSQCEWQWMAVTFSAECDYQSLSKSISLVSLSFAKYTVSVAGREGAPGPKGAPGSPGAPGFPGAQVRFAFFRLFFRSHNNFM